MSEVHAIMLLCAAPKVAEMFRSDPKVADLLDPAVYIAADGEGVIASVVERLQLAKLISGLDSADWMPTSRESAEAAPIAVLVRDESSVTVYRVPDPRNDPSRWPWMGLEPDEG
jgi:UDP-N-acetyl-D-mannosaminuronic acid transferase (WecB/TagA/CpsF family)